MMKAILGVLSSIALIAFTFLCIEGALAVRTNSKHTSQLLMNIDDSVTKLNKTLDSVNGKNGTIQEANETIVRAKDLITLTQLTLYKEQASLQKTDAAVDSLLDSVKEVANTTTSQESLIGSQTVVTLKGIQEDTVSANTELQSLDKATVSVNQTVIDTDNTIKSLDATATDLQEEVHKLTHPTKKKLGFWGTIWAGAQVIHKLSPPLF
jgi:type I site-specific restriction endonuclease